MSCQDSLSDFPLDDLETYSKHYWQTYKDPKFTDKTSFQNKFVKSEDDILFDSASPSKSTAYSSNLSNESQPASPLINTDQEFKKALIIHKTLHFQPNPAEEGGIDMDKAPLPFGNFSQISTVYDNDERANPFQTVPLPMKSRKRNSKSEREEEKLDKTLNTRQAGCHLEGQKEPSNESLKRKDQNWRGWLCNNFAICLSRFQNELSQNLLNDEQEMLEHFASVDECLRECNFYSETKFRVREKKKEGGHAPPYKIKDKASFVSSLCPSLAKEKFISKHLKKIMIEHFLEVAFFTNWVLNGARNPTKGVVAHRIKNRKRFIKNILNPHGNLQKL